MHANFIFFERLKSVRNDLKLSLQSLIKYYIKVTCAFKWARKLPRKTVTYESAKCVPCNTRKCTHDGLVSDLLKWALKCWFYATGPRSLQENSQSEHTYYCSHIIYAVIRSVYLCLESLTYSAIIRYGDHNCQCWSFP